MHMVLKVLFHYPVFGLRPLCLGQPGGIREGAKIRVVEQPNA